MGEKFDEELICQLYPRIPLGSVTADHESVSGDCTVAPFTGATGAGAGGAAAAVPIPAVTGETENEDYGEGVRIVMTSLPLA